MKKVKIKLAKFIIKLFNRSSVSYEDKNGLNIDVNKMNSFGWFAFRAFIKH